MPQISGDQMSANKARRAPLNVLFSTQHFIPDEELSLNLVRRDKMRCEEPVRLFISTAFMIDMA